MPPKQHTPAIKRKADEISPDIKYQVELVSCVEATVVYRNTFLGEDTIVENLKRSFSAIVSMEDRRMFVLKVRAYSTDLEKELRIMKESHDLAVTRSPTFIKRFIKLLTKRAENNNPNDAKLIIDFGDEVSDMGKFSFPTVTLKKFEACLDEDMKTMVSYQVKRRELEPKIDACEFLVRKFPLPDVPDKDIFQEDEAEDN
jgi:hypothetical protein